MKGLNDYPLWTAVITPMLKNGDVDYSSLKLILKEQEAAKNGILILGSTGESLNLNENERREILKFTIAEELNIPIMCGVGGININETKAWVSYLEEQKVDAYLYVTPLYAKPGDEGQYQWFKTLMDLSSRPVMLYNVPSRTGCSLSHKAVQKLNGHPNLWAIKEASGSTTEFKKYCEDAPKARIYSGDDALLPDFAKFAAKGLVSVAANVWPNETHLYTQMSLNNELKDIDLWKNSSNALFSASNPIPLKSLMHNLGKISSNILRSPLSHEDLKEMESLNYAHNQIASWYQKQKGIL